MEGEQPRVLIFAETDAEGNLSSLTRELMGVGGQLASVSDCPLEAVVVGSRLGGAAKALLSFGAKTVHVADHPSLADYNPDLYQKVLEKHLDGAGSLTLLAGHTYIAQDLLPRLAASLGAGLVTDCVRVEKSGPDSPVRFTKPASGGNVLAAFEVTTPVRIATVRARVGSAPEAGSGDGETVALDAPVSEPRVSVLERVMERCGVKLETSRVVVAGGRGMGGGDGFEDLQKLADLLGGAVGASRPPCDSGWISSTSQVGITGKVVAPDLYIAVAISGSSQHLSGMSESAKIVAINQDPDAFIFKVADYGVAGDWRLVLPAFTDSLKKAISG